MSHEHSSDAFYDAHRERELTTPPNRSVSVPRTGGGWWTLSRIDGRSALYVEWVDEDGCYDSRAATGDEVPAGVVEELRAAMRTADERGSP